VSASFYLHICSATGNETVTLSEEIKKYDTEKLNQFLRGEKDLLLNNAHFEILCKREIVGRAFLKMDKQDFRGGEPKRRKKKKKISSNMSADLFL
jgi:hypothetical protein